MTLNDWKQRAEGLDIRTKAFINGEFIEAQAGNTFTCINPANGQVLAEIAECREEDVEIAVKAARDAFNTREWAGCDPRQRKAILLKAADLMEQHKDELALLETLDIGKPIKFTQGDIAGSITTFRYYAEALDKIYGEVGPTGDDDLSMVVREPLGVVGTIVPWNFPMLMASWKVAPALAMGNSVVLKPAEQSPLTALRMAELLHEAGVPAGVFNVLPGFGPTAGKALALHMDVNAIGFTGSTEIGKLIMQYAGQSNLKRVGLECGGKSPHIIMQDCPDLDAAAEAAAGAIFYNQGEVCTAGSRLLVHRSLQAEFVAKLKEQAKAWQPADPLDPDTNFGAMVDQSQMERVLSYIDIAHKEGNELALGGKQTHANTGGFFLEPTIFDNVSPEHTIASEEIFGPVLSVIPFDTPEEAVQIANNTEYGLGAGVWSANMSTALRTARSIDSGMVWVNSWDSCNISVPFGGYKQSGFGRDRSLHALEKYSELKMIWVKL